MKKSETINKRRSFWQTHVEAHRISGLSKNIDNEWDIKKFPKPQIVGNVKAAISFLKYREDLIKGYLD